MDSIELLKKTLFEFLDTIGEYKTEQKKSSIHITNGRAFIGLHPRKSYLGINIVLSHPKVSPAADKVEQVSSNRFHHFYKISSAKEMNKSFFYLLKEAYDLTQIRQQREGIK